MFRLYFFEILVVQKESLDKLIQMSDRKAPRETSILPLS